MRCWAFRPGLLLPALGATINISLFGVSLRLMWAFASPAASASHLMPCMRTGVPSRADRATDMRRIWRSGQGERREEWGERGEQWSERREEWGERRGEE